MTAFAVLNRSPDGSSYFAQEGTFNWLYASIVDMHNDSLYSDSITLDLGTSAAGFPHLYARLFGNFTFVNSYNSDSQIVPYVQAGSVITSCHIIDVNGLIFDAVTGMNFAFNTAKTTIGYENANVFATSFRPGETPDWTSVYAGNDYLTGSSGTEVLQGLNGNDTLLGYAGVDQLWGGAGNDSLVGGDNPDDLYGGAGNDTIAGYTTGDYIDGGADFDTLALTGTYTTGWSIPPKVYMTSVNLYNMEAIRISYGDFVFNPNQIGGSSSIQTIIGGSAYRDGFTVAAVDNGPGVGAVINLATVSFQNWNVNTQDSDFITINGTSGGDTIDGGSQGEAIYAYDGNNLVRAGGGGDNVVAIDGNDTLRGGDGSDRLTGYGGNDVLIGDDDLVAIAYTGGSDTLSGGAGNDTLMGLEGFNVIDGGEGNDTVDYGFTVLNGTLYPVSFHIDLSIVVPLGSEVYNGSGWVNYGDVSMPQCHDQLIGIENVDGSDYDDTIIGNDQANRLYGWSGNDNLIGGLKADTLAGGLGNDTLAGGQGMDNIRGGDGNDLIKGALGTDTLTGGAGADHFLFGSALDGALNIDTITDFTSGSDVIELSASTFTAYAGQVGNHVGTSAYLKYSAATGVLAYDADGAGVGAAVTFAILGTSSHPVTVGADFLIVA
jgi:Ca2+-binding RTX toxin-like protein